MKVRGKFKVSSVTHHATSPGYAFAEIKMNAEYGKPEDNTYSQATPSASLTMTITVPAVIDTFKPGTYFYADFTPVEG
jgi:hypothetical protein